VLYVHGLHIDESVGSPTTYQFQLVIWDYQNITDSANVTISYYKSKWVRGSNVKVVLAMNNLGEPEF